MILSAVALDQATRQAGEDYMLLWAIGSTVIAVMTVGYQFFVIRPRTKREEARREKAEAELAAAQQRAHGPLLKPVQLIGAKSGDLACTVFTPEKKVGHLKEGQSITVHIKNDGPRVTRVAGRLEGLDGTIHIPNGVLVGHETDFDSAFHFGYNYDVKRMGQEFFVVIDFQNTEGFLRSQRYRSVFGELHFELVT